MRYRTLVATFIAGLMPLFANIDIGYCKRIILNRPVMIEMKGNNYILNPFSLLETLDIYSALDSKLNEKIEAPVWTDSIYRFRESPAENDEYLTVAVKANFTRNEIKTFSPSTQHGQTIPLEFLDIYYVIEIKKDGWIFLKRRSDGRKFKIHKKDFDTVFIWQGKLLDAKRGFFPLLGFLSIPHNKSKAPDFYESPDSTGTPFIRGIDFKENYDFYQILDYQFNKTEEKGYFLLGKKIEGAFKENFNTLKDAGMLGWVDASYVLLWRSRVYYHPKSAKNESDCCYFVKKGDSLTLLSDGETKKINDFYIYQRFLNSPLFRSVTSKVARENLSSFYKHFGYPELYPPFSHYRDAVKVGIIGAFTKKMAKIAVDSLLSGINVFFLIDASESEKPFADFVDIFLTNCFNLKWSHNKFETYIYYDKGTSCRFKKLTEGDIPFGIEEHDRTYHECLSKALVELLDRIGIYVKEEEIGPNDIKMAYIMTDAGPHDLSETIFEEIARMTKSLNIKIRFIIPDKSIAEKYNNMKDDKDDAYNDLVTMIKSLQQPNQNYFEKDTFPANQVASDDFKKELGHFSLSLLNPANEAFIKLYETNKVNYHDLSLVFIPDSLLKTLGYDADNQIELQIANHVSCFIKKVKLSDSNSIWERRIMLPTLPLKIFINTFKSAMQAGQSLASLDELIMVNSFITIETADKAKENYKAIKLWMKKQKRFDIEKKFYSILTGLENESKVMVNNKKLWTLIQGEMNNRLFYLNITSEVALTEWTYFTENELFEEPNAK